MFVRSYIAKEMPEAIERIRRELGPDAVILSSRQIRSKGVAGFFGKKLVEVTVAYEPTPGKSIIPERPVISKAVAVEKKAEVPAQKPVKKEEAFSRLMQEKSASAPTAPPASAAPAERRAAIDPACEIEADTLLSQLIEREVSLPVARKIVAQTNEITARFDDDPRKVAENLIIEMVGEPAIIRLKKYRMNIIILLGPTGVGKTTSIVKLAGQFSLEQGLKVGFINTDTFRVAAQEQLRTYAEIMDLPICTIYSPHEMENALLSMQDRDVVLIDTAGKCAADEAYQQEIEEYIRQSGADEVLLTVSASMAYGASRELIENYAFLKRYKLIITKLDEVSAWGSVLNIVSLARQPIAFVTTGQNVPYDIVAPDAGKVARNLLWNTNV